MKLRQIRDHTGRKKSFAAPRGRLESVLARLTSKDPELGPPSGPLSPSPTKRGIRMNRRVGLTRPGGLHSGLYVPCHRPISGAAPRKMRVCMCLELYEKAAVTLTPRWKELRSPYRDKVSRPICAGRNGGSTDRDQLRYRRFQSRGFEYEEAMHREGLTTCAIDMPGSAKSHAADRRGVSQRGHRLPEHRTEVDANGSEWWGAALAVTGQQRWPSSKRNAPRR